MNIKNICTKKTFTTKEGKEKTYWNIVGNLKTMDNGNIFIALNMFPDTPFYVFEIKKKEETAGFEG